MIVQYRFLIIFVS